VNESQRNQLIFALYIPSALSAIAFTLLTPILPLYAGQLTNAYALIGIILAAMAFGRVFGDLPSSWFIRRYGMKKTMLIGLWMSLLPMVLLFVVNTIWLTIVLLLAVGFGHALYNISRHAYVTVVIRTSARGRAIGLLGGVFRIGNFIGPLLGGWIGGSLGLRYGFIGFGIISLLTIFFVWRYMEIHETDSEVQQDKAQHLLMWQLVREHQGILATAGTGQILAQLTREGWRVLIPLYAANILGLNVQTIGLIVGAGSAMDMFFFYLSGVVMDKFGRKWSIVPSFILQGIGVGLIYVSHGAVALAFVAAFIGFANGLSSGTMMTLGSDFAPPELRGEFLSLWRLIGDVGSMGAPVIIGSVAQVLVLQMSILAVMGSSFAAVLLFAFLVPETLKRKPVKYPR
jgi:MFS family permease